MATKKTGGRAPTLGEYADRAEKAQKSLVRLKPYDPKKGYVLMRYSMSGILFEENKGWYLVDPHIAEKLRDVRVRPGMTDHPHYELRAFDVCTPAEAKRIANAENELAVTQGRAMPHNPNQIEVPARDVTAGSPMGPQSMTPPPAPSSVVGVSAPVPVPAAAKRQRLAPEGRSSRPG